MNCKLMTLHGATRSIADWARIYGRHPTTVRDRLYRGLTLLEALTTPTDNAERITIHGETRTIKNWAKVAKIGCNAIYTRRRRGWTAERMIAPRQAPRYGLTAFGKTQSYSAWAEEYGIHRATLHDRIKRMGIEPEVALLLPVVRTRQDKPE